MFVTLAIFSGRRDPEWTVPSSHPKLEEIKCLLHNARSQGFTYNPRQMPARLGYKGFLVKDKTMSTPELIIGPETLDLQKLLLETCPEDVLSEGTRERVWQAINDGNVRAGLL